MFPPPGFGCRTHKRMAAPDAEGEGTGNLKPEENLTSLSAGTKNWTV